MYDMDISEKIFAMRQSIIIIFWLHYKKQTSSTNQYQNIMYMYIIIRKLD